MTSAFRLRAPAALLAVLAVTFVGSGCGSDGDPVSSQDARTLLQNAVNGTSAVESGDLALELKADVEGIDSLENGLEVRLEGPFKSNGKGKLPSLDWDVAFDGAGQKLSGGIVATRRNAFVRFQGRSYELGESAFASVARRLELTRPGRPLTLEGLGLDPASWLKDARVEDGDRIGGDDTRKVTGSVDVRKVITDMVDLLKSPAARRQLKRAGGTAPVVPTPSESEIKEIEDAIEHVDVELNVDENDVLRRLSTEIGLNVQDGGNGKDVKGEISFAYELREVGTNPDIRAPSGARPLTELLGGLGLGELSGGRRFYGKPK